LNLKGLFFISGRKLTSRQTQFNKMFLSLCIVLSFIYLASILFLIFGWKITKTRSSQKIKQPSVLCSLIIAFRNEEKNLPVLLECIENQSYPKDNYEIILVNDHSEDEGVLLVSSFQAKLPNLKILHLADNQLGKKAAINLGITNAKHDWIISTDADCQMDKNWLSEITDYIETCDVGMVIGPVELYGNSFFQKLQIVEFVGIQAVTGGMSGLGKPIMCNGANLAFRKLIYFEAQKNLCPEISSGDDMFFLAFLKTKQKKIGYLNKSCAIVKTQAESSLSSFFAQRVRWASKPKIYRDKHIFLSGFFLAIMYSCILLSILYGIFSYNWFPFFVIGGTKLISDTILFISVNSLFRKNKLLFLQVLVEAFLLVYYVFTPILSLFWSPKWKKRRIQR
jgi:poly-beta-1,6-N-acetyl-D-glucosamine synthase